MIIQKTVFFEELEQAFDHFPKYRTKILLGESDAKDWRENIFRQLGMRVYIRIVMIMVLK